MIPTNTTVGGTWAIIAGFILSVAILIIAFLDPAFISDKLALLIDAVIYLAAATFHLTVVGQMNQVIASLKNTLASAKKK